MKAKKGLVVLCSILCACCIGGGVATIQTVESVAKAETATVNTNSVDVASEVNMAFHSETDTTVEIDLTFGNKTHVFPVGTTSATWVNDHATMGDVDLMQYIKIGGKTAREIVVANAHGQLDKAYKGPISTSLGGEYAPIGVLVDSNGIIRIKTLTDYCAYENLTITLVSEGFAWTVNDPTLGTYTMTLSKDITFYNNNGKFVPLSEKLDVTSKVDMQLHSEINGVVEVNMTFANVSNIFPVGKTSATWVNDNSTMGDVDLMSYIKIGDKTAREIVVANANGTTTYKGGDVPMSWGGQYAPIGVLVDNNGIIRIKVLTEYCAFENLAITLLSGFKWTINDPAMGTITLETTADRVFEYYKGKFLEKLNRVVLDDKATMTVNNLDVGGASDLEMTFDGVTEVRAVDVMNDPNGWAKDGSWVNDNTKGYGGNDYSRGVDLMEYILINGRTAREIVVDNQQGKTNYVGPINSSMGAIFGPIGVCVEPNGVFRIKVLNEYCNYTNLRITLKAGLEWRVYNETNEQFDTALVTETDTTFYYSNGSMVKWDSENDYVNLAENITVNQVGSSEDCDIYQIHFNQTFNSQATWIMDKQTENPALYALQNVIAINGKTVQEINDETDDSDYEYKTTVVNWESHKVPVRILFDYYDSKTLFTVYVHKNYVAENLVDTIALSPFAWSSYSVSYALKEKVEFKAVTNTAETIFKQVCYVTFGDADTVSVLEGNKLATEQIPINPTKESTQDTDFLFNGWYYTNVSGNEMKFEPDFTVVDSNYTLYAKFTEVARRYTITYLDKDGNVYQTQQVCNGEEITHIATPEQAHYTGNWVYQDDGTAPVIMPMRDITFKVAYEATVYKVVFYADSNGMYELKTLTYTIENPNIQEPAVAPKEGFTGEWESYTLTGGDVKVCPIYTEINRNNGSSVGGCNGCGASIGGALSVIGLVTLLGGVVLLKKKENK